MYKSWLKFLIGTVGYELRRVMSHTSASYKDHGINEYGFTTGFAHVKL